jgi:hypothetical protein
VRFGRCILGKDRSWNLSPIDRRWGRREFGLNWLAESDPTVTIEQRQTDAHGIPPENFSTGLKMLRSRFHRAASSCTWRWYARDTVEK